MSDTRNNGLAVIGIGNQGRKDDGLGWAFLDGIAQMPDCPDLFYRYQLQIEDAELISAYRRVIFVDATHETLPEGWTYRSVPMQYPQGWTTHRMSPGSIVNLCNTLYDAVPVVRMIAIAGSLWGLGIGLSSSAGTHLQRALNAWPQMKSAIESCQEHL